MSIKLYLKIITKSPILYTHTFLRTHNGLFKSGLKYKIRMDFVKIQDLI